MRGKEDSVRLQEVLRDGQLATELDGEVDGLLARKQLLDAAIDAVCHIFGLLEGFLDWVVILMQLVRVFQKRGKKQSVSRNSF